MKIVFLSNFFNHHQRPLSDALYARAERFAFIENAVMDEDRMRLGWSGEGGTGSSLPSYVCSMSDEQAYASLREADVIIAGSAPENQVQQCLREGKLVFRYSERPLKNGLEPLKYLPRLARWRKRNPTSARVYLLAASAYAASDYAKFGLFRDRAYRWGYFPELRRYGDASRMIASKDPTHLIWCGRFIDCKRPGDALEVACRLRNAGVPFFLEMVGAGPLEGELRMRIGREHLEGCVSVAGALSPADVRDRMEHAGVLMFTSDAREGWGAVVNEAMNSGCAVVASCAAGSVPYLVRHGENGLAYEAGDTNALYAAIRQLLDNRERQQTLGLAAYQTIAQTWNASVAADRFCLLAESVLGGWCSPELFEDGPCSRA